MLLKLNNTVPGLRVFAFALGALTSGFPSAKSVTAAPRGSNVRVIDHLPADLSGTWEIAFPSDAATPPPDAAARWRPVTVPGSWQASGYRGHGFAWLRVRFRVTSEIARRPLAFASTQIRDADRAFLDGEPIGASGAFPPAYAKGTLVDRVYALPTATLATDGVHVLALRVYNAGPRGGGVTGRPRIEAFDAALAGRWRRDAVRLLLAAAIGATGLAVLVFWLRDRRQREFLFFVFYAGCISAYQITWLSAWDRARSPDSWQFRLNMFFIFAILAFYVLFNLRIFGRPLQKRHVFLVGAIAVLSALALAWPRVDDLYLFLAIDEALFAAVAVEMLAILVRDARRRVPYAAPVLAGTIVCVAGAVWDILQDLGILGDPAGTFRLLGPAILIFTIVYLWVMADRFARATRDALTDALTGLPNRKLLFDRLSQELARARRSREPCALAILDLDHFKTFNDRYGHLAGDKLLRAVAGAIKRSTRESDLVARYGGEEFVVVLPGSDADVARRCLERVRFEVAQARSGSIPETRSASIGAVVFEPGCHPSVGMMPLLRSADAALYAAKAAGRNRLVLAESPAGEVSPESGPNAIPNVRVR